MNYTRTHFNTHTSAATACSVKDVVLPGLTFRGAGEDRGGLRPDGGGAVYRR